MATIDLTLDSFKVPAIESYTPPFGTKIVKTDANKGGLSTVEVNSNIMMPFANMRPKVITENSSTTEIEYDAKLCFSASLLVGATLELDDGAYEGCRVQITNLSSFTCTVEYDNATLVSVPIGANNVDVLWTGSTWIVKATVPTGTILDYGGSIAPAGFELCIGQTALRSNYSGLIRWATQNNVIGTGKLFGDGDGSTTFVFPDLREMVLVGIGHNATHVFDSTETDPSTGVAGKQNHDEYTIGQFKDDQIQNITGKLSGVRAGIGGSGTGAFQTSGSAENVSTWSGSWGTLSFDASLVARTGTTTHGKQIGINYIIKI